jgi:hypothetical protein
MPGAPPLGIPNKSFQKQMFIKTTLGQTGAKTGNS